MKTVQLACLGVLGSILSYSATSTAQLVECDLVNLDPSAAPNACIGKILPEQIGAGHGDAFTAGSAVYLIKRDPARSIRRGRQLFQRKFSATEGLGPRVNLDSSGDITANRALGAGFADSCAACHGRPKGSAGFGGDVATRPDSRDAPHLFGLGLVEQLADEMTRELRSSRDKAVGRAISSGLEQRQALRAKGISFGRITVGPQGNIDSSEIKGVDTDLRIRPFFHHGQTVSIREFIIGAFKDEMGMQAWDPVLCAVTDPQAPQALVSPAGFSYDPRTDNYERPPVCEASQDGDSDGVIAEVDPALVDHMEFYLLNYFKPGSYRSSRATRRGQEMLDEVGCTVCHRANLTIDADRRIADVETVYDPVKGIFNDLFATASSRYEIVEDSGFLPPMLLPKGEEFLVENIYTDFKRHDLGPSFHEREYDGSLVTEFLTEPLWGVGSTAPYGHDGRSINLDAVIRRHGGEAGRSARRYTRLDTRDQYQLLGFLQSLVLFPPDDTASNLNPGLPGDKAGIQNPASHGTINLGALFQIPEEGAE